MGVREGRPTLAGVLEVLATSPVVLLVDELDKVVFDGSGWNRSVMAEIFALLDRSVPREAFTYLKDCSISREEFKARIEGQGERAKGQAEKRDAASSAPRPSTAALALPSSGTC